MDNIGFLSILPPLLAILLAIKTRQVFVALLSGLFIGRLILSSGNPLTAFFSTINSLVDVFNDAGNTRTVLFSCLVGSLIILIQSSGGVSGFVNKINSVLQKSNKSDLRHKKRSVQFFALITGMIVFIESNISVLTIGTIFRPVFDKLKISRQKLAFLADSVSSPVCILIPLNAWGAYVMGILLTYDYDSPFTILIKSELFNFYPILLLLIILFLIYTGKDFGSMKKAEADCQLEKTVNQNKKFENELSKITVKKGITHKTKNMIIPIFTMIFSMPIYLINSGWDKTFSHNYNFTERIFYSIGEGSGSEAVLFSVITAIIIALILYRTQRIFNLTETVELSLKGMSTMLPLALLMVLAFSIGNLCKDLGTGTYIASVTGSWLSPALIPFILFVVSGIISFSTGTSWGTYAIMLAIALPMVDSTSANLFLSVGAVLGGGVFGDHCSPISDTTIISSMASSCDHIEHVKTQLPYALAAGTISALFYLAAGFLF